MNTLQGIGWQWRTDGVVVCLQIDGVRHSILVPLHTVWHAFARELAAAGAPMPPVVSGELTVSGLFSSIAHAVSSVAHVVTHNPITKAANSVVHTATHAVLHNPLVNAAGSLATHVPVLGPLAHSVAQLVTAPLAVADQLAAGGRLDRVAMGNLKASLASVKQVAPYAQTVLSLVPAVGEGLSGAIGAGLALASGQNITDALVSGVRSALPGGALAAAAFDVAHAAMQGKPITAIALNALPLPAAQKNALVQGVSLARDLASGKKVSQALVDAATHALPPNLVQAVQIGAAIAHAKNLQGAVGTLAHAASLTSAVQTGTAAAHAIKALSPRSLVPPHLVAAVKQGLAAKKLVAGATVAASQGHAGASQLLTALNAHHAAATKLAQGMSAFTARYHSLPSSSVSGPFAHHSGAGIHGRFHGTHHAGPAAGQHHQFKARYHSVGAPHHGGIHARFGAVPQLYPVRMPYQTASHLRFAFGR